jgi:hypothetical protein
VSAVPRSIPEVGVEEIETLEDDREEGRWMEKGSLCDDDDEVLAHASRRCVVIVRSSQGKVCLAWQREAEYLW